MDLRYKRKSMWNVSYSHFSILILTVAIFVFYSCEQEVAIQPLFEKLTTEETNITNFAQVMNCNVDRFKLFFHGMLEQGVYLAPSAFEAGFVSAKHGKQEIKSTMIAAEQVFSKL